MRAHFRRVGGVLAGVVLVTGALSAPAQAEPASLSGTLTSDATGEPVQGCAYVYTAGTYDWAGGSCTDEAGQWVVDGLESGVGYKVEFSPSDASHLAEWSDEATGFDSAATHVAPATVDESLAPGREVGEETLTGVVTSEETGLPVAACVGIVSAADGSHVDSACTDETGIWAVATLSASQSYKIEVYPHDGAHLGEWAQDADSFETAQSYAAPGQVDVALARGGILEGTLTAADGTPVEAASVDIYDARDPNPWNVAASASTDYDGNWAAVVPPGDYRVHFESYPVQQWAFGQTVEQDAAIVAVASGGTKRVDDRFLKRVNVSGMITSDTTGAGVSGACVAVWTHESYPDGNVAGFGCADSSGHYSFDLSQTGEFIAQFSDQTGEFLSEFTGDTRIVAEATSFVVTRDAPAVVDASLAAAAVITGLAVDARTGEPVENVCPAAFVGHAGDFADGQVTINCSDAEGRWQLGGLEAGSYALRLDPSWEDGRHVSTWAFKATSQASADLISVGDGQRKSIRGVKLGLGGTVSGRITDPAGQPVAGAWVSLEGRLPGRAGPGEGRYVGYTDENGEYVVNGVPAGDYKPVVYGESDGPWAPEWSGDVTLPSLATPISVRIARTTSFDAALVPAAHVTGTIVDASGNPVEGYWTGSIFAADGTHVGDFDAGNGFSSSSLPSGSFTLLVENWETGESGWYDGATSQADAQRVTLATGEQREITFHLP